MALHLYGICYEDDHPDFAADGVRLVPCRDLAAIVGEAPYVPQVPDEAALAAHHGIIEAACRKGEVLPAPPGTIFRTAGALERWMELHYVALSDALAFVADRVEARVHVTHADPDREPEDAGTDLAALAAEVMRILRRRAVAAVPLRRELATGIAIGAAFLVERTLWREFEEEVASVREAHHAGGGGGGAQVSMSGPWPPYDFVRIEFGG